MARGKKTVRESKLLVARHVKVVSVAKNAGDLPHPAVHCDRCDLTLWPGTHIASTVLAKFHDFVKEHERCEFR